MPRLVYSLPHPAHRFKSLAALDLVGRASGPGNAFLAYLATRDARLEHGELQVRCTIVMPAAGFK